MILLKRRIQHWIQAGIISSEQGDAILELEQSTSHSYSFYGFIALGVVTIGTGIVSLIGFNWEEIPDFLKLLVDFALLGGVATWILREARIGRRVVMEALLLFFQILVLGSIGLISQVFHTAGELFEALFLWTGITIPMVLFAKARLPTHLWIGSFFLAIFLWIVDGTHRPELDTDVMVLYFVAIPPFLLPVLGLPFHRFFTDRGFPAGMALLLWALLFTLGGTILLPGFDILSETDILGTRSYYWSIIPTLAFLSLGLALFLFPGKKIIAAIFGLVMVLHMIHLSPRTEYESVWSAILFILEWMGLAIIFLNMGKQRVFDALLAGTGIRFIIVYFEAFGNLALTGIGLILSGLMIIGFTFAYIKWKERISQWLQTITA